MTRRKTLEFASIEDGLLRKLRLKTQNLMRIRQMHPQIVSRSNRPGAECHVPTTKFTKPINIVACARHFLRLRTISLVVAQVELGPYYRTNTSSKQKQKQNRNTRRRHVIRKMYFGSNSKRTSSHKRNMVVDRILSTTDQNNYNLRFFGFDLKK